jgi:hypothetical protein
MLRSDLIDLLTDRNPHLSANAIDQAVKTLLEHMSVNGFMVYVLNYRAFEADAKGIGCGSLIEVWFFLRRPSFCN